MAKERKERGLQQDYLPGLRAQLNSPDRNEFTTEHGEVIPYDPNGPKPVALPVRQPQPDLSEPLTAEFVRVEAYRVLARQMEWGVVATRAAAKLKRDGMPPSAVRGRRLAKRVLERMKEFSGPGCHGLRRLSVGRNVWESIVMMSAEDRRFPDTTKGLFLCGFPVVWGVNEEPDVVCYYG